MKNKFNWGHGITLFYLLFVAAVVSVLIASFSVDHSLVANDYYAKDLAYQEQYDKMKNFIDANEDDIAVNVLTEQKMIEVLISSQYQIKGKIHFYRPSNESQDFTIDIIGDKTTISTEHLEVGKWILKIEWQEGSRSFYYEHQIYLT